MESLKLYINISGGNLQEVCGPKDFVGEIYLVDFDNNDSKELSDAYSLIIADDNIISLPLKELDVESATDEFTYEAECSICEREERINLNQTDWMPSVNLDEDDELGPICPECQSKWVVFPKGDDPKVISHEIRLDQIHQVSGLVKHLEMRRQQAILEASKAANAKAVEEGSKVEWLRKFHLNMVKALIKVGAFEGPDEADACLSFHVNLHGEPAIIKTGGQFELLGDDICYNVDRRLYTSVEIPSAKYYVEVENSECLRAYPANVIG